MKRSNFALRLQPSLMDEARKAAESEGVALNQLINIAVAEKISTLRTEDYFLQRASRADRAETMRILSRAGQGNPPLAGDELPPDLETQPQNSRGKSGKRSAKLPKRKTRKKSRT